ncbi:hypothetical protein TWF694_006686 [Orbilia ellipsospora]|uniref:Zn(2)-C6 fungal-type domain-containing protein n=1 Tax=Orbilia ellipsospora TaxID=2528407 RepID=A0AAV9XLS7_9PEZI
MVFHGVSRGCAACRQKRKKCDEQRPECTRCVKAGRNCPGYASETDIIFRNSNVASSSTSASARMTAAFTDIRYSQVIDTGSQVDYNHCFLSIRQLQSLTKSQVELFAINSFLYNYTLIPKDSHLSRGFLSGIPSLIENENGVSNISKAARIVIYASLKNTEHGSYFAHLASIWYLDLLQSFQASMANLSAKNTIESVTIAIILGLYEMISTTTENPSDHTIHCHGAASILSNSLTPFSKNPTVGLLQGSNVPASEKIQGYFLVWPHDLAPFQPDKDFPAPCLDALLCRVSPIFREGSDIFASQNAPPARLRQLREYAWCLEQEMAQWPGTQPKEWKPKTLGYIPPILDGKGILEGTTCSPSRIDKYYDAYVSGVWNSYRKVRLVILSLLYECDIRLKVENPDDCFPACLTLQSYVKKHSGDLAEDMAASLFFHLLLDPSAALPESATQHQVGEFKLLYPNKACHALLIVHSLHAASVISIVPEYYRNMFREHLVWIGEFMGIGQALMLAEPSFRFSREYVVDGHIMVWAGALVNSKGIQGILDDNNELFRCSASTRHNG